MTTTALTQREAAQGLVSPGLTPDQIALIKRTLMSSKRAPTDDELALFVHQCDRTGLDPFSRQIYAIYRKDRDGVERMGIQVSIDGLRLIADRTQKYAPGNSYWCGEDGIWRDVWLTTDPPAAARVVVRKLVGGQLVEFSVPAKWGEYKPSYDGAGLWRKMPTLMIAKCSEALALRKAFPNETSGLYTSEEMAQADVADEAAIVEHVKQTFDATEIPAERATSPEAVVEADARDQAYAGTIVEPAAPTNGDDPNAVVTGEQTAALTNYLQAIKAPDAFTQFGLMTLGKNNLSELTVGEAHTLMQDAKARFQSE